jgi:hypothetical protein
MRASKCLIAFFLVIASTCFAQSPNCNRASPTSNPSSREAAAMAYDAGRGDVVLFGGLNGTFPNFQNQSDTWF